MKKEIMKNVSDYEFEQLVLNSANISQICKKLNLRLQGSNYKTINKRISTQKIPIDHFCRNTPKGGVLNAKYSLDEIFIKNSKYSDTKALKKKILKNDLLSYKCEKCSNLGRWENDILTLQLDHINGVRNDNRIENLRFLCPNCHSQTFTHSGKRFKKAKSYCDKCGGEFQGLGEMCIKCHYYKCRKVKNRPHKSQILKMVEESSYIAVGKKYGVSDNTIRNWLK